MVPFICLNFVVSPSRVLTAEDLEEGASIRETMLFVFVFLDSG